MKELIGEMSAKGLRIAIVVARFNSFITDKLLAGALEAISKQGGDANQVPVARVPGSLELAVVARKFAAERKFDAVICLGCVIMGETSHYDCVVDGARQGLVEVATQTGVPVVFGVLTCANSDQALDRAGGKHGNAGANAAAVAIEMANLLKKI
jgi:6,7-dimethyl-8-ribityllumazine synthase